MYEYMSKLFTLRIKAGPSYAALKRNEIKNGMIIIHAYEGKGDSMRPYHNRIDVEVRQGGRIIFPKGQLYCGLPSQYSTDGIHAKELVLSLVAMKPGDTDGEYFADSSLARGSARARPSPYTDAQLAFARTYGEELDLIRQMRYCDDSGNVRER